MSELTISTSVVIGGNAVEKLDFKVGDYDVYRMHDPKYGEATVYFVNQLGRVVSEMLITADCGQNSGYVDEITGKSY